MNEPTYTIIISERQRHYLHLAISQFCQEDPGEELDAQGNDIPTVLVDLLDNETMPLSTEGVNSFVL